MCQGVKCLCCIQSSLKWKPTATRYRGGVLNYLLFFICFPKTGLFRFKWQIKLPPTSLHPVIFQLTSVHCTLYVKCYVTRVSEALSSTFWNLICLAPWQFVRSISAPSFLSKVPDSGFHLSAFWPLPHLVPRWSSCPKLSGGSCVPPSITLFPAFCLDPVLDQAPGPLSQNALDLDIDMTTLPPTHEP